MPRAPTPTSTELPQPRPRKRYDRMAVLDRIQLLMDIMRVQANWDQTEFAAKAGLTPPKLSHYLSRRHRPDIDSLASIAERIGISMEWLVFGAGPIWARDLDLRGIGPNEATMAMASVLRDLADAMAQSVVAKPGADRTGVDRAVQRILNERMEAYKLNAAGAS